MADSTTPARELTDDELGYQLESANTDLMEYNHYRNDYLAGFAATRLERLVQEQRRRAHAPALHAHVGTTTGGCRSCGYNASEHRGGVMLPRAS